MRNVMRGGVMRGGVMLGGVMRSQRGGFDPLTLFSAGQQGAWYEPADLSTLFLERTSPTTPASVGDPVGTMLDKSPNANHVTAPSDAARPTLRRTPGGLYYLDFDGADDILKKEVAFLNDSDLFFLLAANASTADLAFNAANNTSSDKALGVRPNVQAYTRNTDYTPAEVVVGSPFVGEGHYRKDTGGITVVANGTEGGTATQPPHTDLNEIAVGGFSDVTPVFGAGAFFGALLVNEIPASGELASVRQYFADKAGVAL